MPFVVTGSSDRHIRLYDLSTQRGWTTDPTPPPHTPHPPTTFTAPFPAPLSPFDLPHSLLSRFSAATVIPGAILGLDNRMAWRLSQLGWAGNSLAPTPGHASGSVAQEGQTCQACGGEGTVQVHGQKAHKDLVRAVAMDQDVIVSASYDSTIKVRWTTNRL